MRKVLIGFVVGIQLVIITSVAYLLIPQPELGRHLTLSDVNRVMRHYKELGVEVTLHVQPTMENRPISVKLSNESVEVFITAGTLNQFRTTDNLEQAINKGIFEEKHSV